MTILLSVIVPTYNERDNIAQLLQQLIRALETLASSYEIIVVDDQSPDGTAAVVQQYAHDAVRLLRRTCRRDLSTALADGFNVAQGEYVLAMDADLQHDPFAVPALLQTAQCNNADVVVATRYAAGGAVQGWSPWRLALSRCATQSVRRCLAQPVSDPLSGFFLLRREVWVKVRTQLQPAGFKLLLDIFLAQPSLHCEEYGYCFTARQYGRSKLGVKPIFAFLRTVWRSQRKVI